MNLSNMVVIFRDAYPYHHEICSSRQISDHTTLKSYIQLSLITVGSLIYSEYPLPGPWSPQHRGQRQNAQLPSLSASNKVHKECVDILPYWYVQYHKSLASNQIWLALKHYKHFEMLLSVYYKYIAIIIIVWAHNKSSFNGITL